MCIQCVNFFLDNILDYRRWIMYAVRTGLSYSNVKPIFIFLPECVPSFLYIIKVMLCMYFC